jgi:hypothetical protein
MGYHGHMATAASPQWHDPVSSEKARTVPCPGCAAAAGEPCTYIVNASIVDPPQRIGTPMIRVHPQRRDVIRARRRRDASKAALAARPSENQDPGLASRRVIAAAQREFEVREYQAMAAWLRENAWILLEAGRERRPDGSFRGGTYLRGQD